MISCPSPNFDDRPKGCRIKYLILHYTGMATGAEALERLCQAKSKVSAHYLIEEDGRVFSLVPEDMRAWHAGVAAWDRDHDINGLSIGIEMVNPGHDGPNYKGNYRLFPAAQMTALIGLAHDILGRHKISPWHILGHSDVAPKRRNDPGELFDWKSLASEGIGFWPSGDVKIPEDESVNEVFFQQKLANYGYKIKITGARGQQACAVIRAFQRHFRPTDISGIFDKECWLILEDLLSSRKSFRKNY